MTLTGQTLGQYELIHRGERFQIFGKNYTEALEQASRLIQGLSQRKTVSNQNWYVCDYCGKSVDIGEPCPICANDLEADLIDIDAYMEGDWMLNGLPETDYRSPIIREGGDW